MHRSIALFLLFPFFLTACSNSGGPSGDVASDSISGNWQMSLQPSNTKIAPHTQWGFLLQNGNILTGSLMLIDVPCSGTGTVSGSVSGTSVSMTLNPTGLTVELSGAIGSTPGSMSGNYTILSNGCTGPNASPDLGTWTATLVTPLNGSFQGNFDAHSGTSYQLGGTVTQGPNTGNLNATLSGTFNITGYCFTSANIVGVISGTSVVMNLVDSTGTQQIGEIDGTSSLDGTSMNGTLRYLGDPSGSVGCRTPQGGPLCLSWQTGQCSTSGDQDEPKASSR